VAALVLLAVLQQVGVVGAVAAAVLLLVVGVVGAVLLPLGVVGEARSQMIAQERRLGHLPWE
jgi:hypothetical protein